MKNIIGILFVVVLCFCGNNASAQRARKETNEKIFMATEVVANFPGGEDSMMAFLIRNVNYPRMAANAGIGGVVYISFVVNKDGTISQSKVERDIGGGCGKEALRVVRLMPNWTPAYNKGQAVRSHFTLPFSFTVEEDKKKSRKERRRERINNR